MDWVERPFLPHALLPSNLSPLPQKCELNFSFLFISPISPSLHSRCLFSKANRVNPFPPPSLEKQSPMTLTTFALLTSPQFADFYFFFLCMSTTTHKKHIPHSIPRDGGQGVVFMSLKSGGGKGVLRERSAADDRGWVSRSPFRTRALSLASFLFPCWVVTYVAYFLLLFFFFFNKGRED